MYDLHTKLMLEFQAGNEGAFNALMDAYYARVVNVVYRYAGSGADAEDIAQEVFLRVYRSKANFRPKAKFSTWLYTIVTRLCYNELRNRARHKLQPMPEEYDLEDGRGVAGDRPVEAVRHSELADLIKEALDGLPENQRLAVILNKWEGLRYEEIAEAMGLSIMAVKSLLFRARENLKGKLEKYL